ncbi:class II aldolase/adducin family protein [Candidatus Desulforudis audaxviator]|uniref:Class II aldolase/adducin family protein n=1 Tax=Desulforudis audaxviator (strain MP104C) TaxID=477974 RepID=B1I2P3_DESAP|nr:class II aldolase/adducin family protein [Candidatus Desulforudis audaxviator]ACA59184.1 class II aldolase/adducin family protein [Candidatus Desulforudis audaxviator MP104C]AZK59254.1 class II aldolase/adducin family protein [Candidatus Desulforudis audaxviator]
MSLAADKAKEKLVRLGQKVAEAGLVIGTWGNLSYRVAKDNVVVITPSGLDYHRMSTRDMVVIGMDGRVVEGDRKPSTELALHLAVYRTRPDVQCVIHTHSPYAGAMAVNRMPIPPILEDAVAMIRGSVPVTEYAVSGSRRLAELAAQALGRVNAVLLANHGVVGVGRTPEDAFQVCQQVERAAQVYILARAIGTPVALTDQEVARLLEYYTKEYGQKEGAEG